MDGVAGILRYQVRERPDEVALSHQDSHLTFADIDARANRFAGGLRHFGDERVAVLDKSCLEYFDVLFGVAKAHAVLCTVNFRLTAEETAYVLNDCEASLLIVGEEFVGLIESIEPELKHATTILVLGEHPRWQSYQAWCDSAAPAEFDEESAPDEIVCQIYTSGTTGRPKGVMLRNSGFAEFTRNHRSAFHMNAGTVFQLCLPMFHIGGIDMSLVALSAGGRVVIIREPDPTTVLHSLSHERVTHAGLVPALMAAVMAEPDITDHDLSALGYMLYGASPITQDVLRRALTVFGCSFVQSYGMTESCGGFVALEPEAHDLTGPHVHRIRAAGKVLPGVELRIVDAAATLQPLPENMSGEIQIRARQTMAGYWKQPEATAETLLPDGWLRTGDIGYLDADGYVYIQDRLKDMIISGGENIYPTEVENALASHPAITDVAVIGVPDPRWGETPKAVVVRAPGSTLTAAEVIGHARARIAGYKCPTSVDFLDSLPRNASGKVLKRELRKPYWEDHDRQIS